MEFHDKMKKLKTNVYKAALMLGAIWAGLLFQQFFGDNTMRSSSITPR